MPHMKQTRYEKKNQPFNWRNTTKRRERVSFQKNRVFLVTLPMRGMVCISEENEKG